MKDGWWVNYETGQMVIIEEHELDIRMPAVATVLNVPAEVFVGFQDYEPVTDRIRFLVDLMKLVPLMRIRGHGVYVTMEFWSPDGDDKPLVAIGWWVERNAGPALLLNVTNIATGVNTQVMAGDWTNFVAHRVFSKTL